MLFIFINQRSDGCVSYTSSMPSLILVTWKRLNALYVTHGTEHLLKWLYKNLQLLYDYMQALMQNNHTKTSPTFVSISLREVIFIGDPVKNLADVWCQDSVIQFLPKSRRLILLKSVDKASREQDILLQILIKNEWKGHFSSYPGQANITDKSVFQLASLASKNTHSKTLIGH